MTGDATATSLDLRQFRSADAGGDPAIYAFLELRGAVSAVYSGGDILQGFLVGTRDGDEVRGHFAQRYADGTTAGGEVALAVEQTAEGVRVQATWTIGTASHTRLLDALPQPDESTEVTLRDVTEHNIDAVLKLKVAPHQRDFVADVARSIAQAHHNDVPGWYQAIYADDEPVGFVMLAYEPDEAGVDHPGWYLWRFLIDAEHQRGGHGRRALELVCHHILRNQEPHVLWTSWVDAPGGPEPFYRKFGFEPTGELDEGEVVAKLERWPD